MPVKTSKKIADIHRELRRLVLAGEWAMGELLPREMDLCERFGCSVGTMNKAMGLLVHEGLVERKARVGTRVTGAKPAAVETRSVELDAFAFIYPSDQHEGIWRTVKGFQQAANDRGRRVVMLSSGADYHKETEFLQRLQEFDVRGAVIYPNVATPEMQVAFSQLILSCKCPLVLASVNLMGLGRPMVGLDNFDAGYAITRHLIEQGARRVGYLSNRAGSMAMRDRLQGYRRAMADAGLEVRAEQVMVDASMKSNFVRPLEEPTRLATKFFASAGALDAVVGATDFLAYGVAEAAKGLGLSIPRDLKVAGIDGYFLPETPDFLPITTYRSPCERIGRLAFEKLEQLVAGQPVSGDESLVRGEVIRRASTA